MTIAEQIKAFYMLPKTEQSQYVDRFDLEGKFMEKLELASEWYNSKTKAELIQWATERGLDIGQNETQLHDNWNEKVIEAKAREYDEE